MLMVVNLVQRKNRFAEYSSGTREEDRFAEKSVGCMTEVLAVALRKKDH